MSFLVLGLVIFLGTHSVRILAGDWRARTIARVGHETWKGGYSLIALAGFALLVWGYGEARQSGAVLYDPPLYMRHVTALLMLVSFVLLAAVYVPGNHIKAAVGHPMAAGAKLWALAHLLSNGGLADVVLFGAFLAWAVADFGVSRRRDRIAGTRYPAGSGARTALAVAVGALAWAVFAFWAHLWLTGVRPMG
ncbi:MAG: NnrU family protein [Burkholderiales bacterium]